MKYNLAIVKSLYYVEIAEQLSRGVDKEIQKFKSKFSFRIKNFFVSGVFEIPIIISKNINKFDAFIVLGCVIKGDTPHFNFISKSTIEAIMKLSVEYKKPIGNGIITCFSKKQAIERSKINGKNKGGEATRAILTVLGNPYINKKKYEQLFSRNKKKS